MRLVKAEAWYVPQETTYIGAHKQAEQVGRVCYHSEKKITSSSYKEFISRCLSQGHCSPLEHGIVYLILSEFDPIAEGLIKNKWSTCVSFDGKVYVTTNLRVIYELQAESVLSFATRPTKHHIKAYTIGCTCAIEVYKDLTRHRTLSPMIESTRYCNYMSSKFGKSIAFMSPCWLKEEDKEWFTTCLTKAENSYFEALEKGWTVEQASYFLPQGTKATMFLTATLPNWKRMLDIRFKQITGPVRPDVLELTTQINNIITKLENGEC